MSLPLEILGIICSYLTATIDGKGFRRSTSYKTLYNLCLASKSFACIGQPYLWQVIETDFSWYDPDNQIWPRLLAAVAARPHIANWIQELIIDDSWPTPAQDDGVVDPWIVPRMNDLLVALDISEQLKKDLTALLEGGMADGFIAVLLGACRNLEETDFAMSNSPRYSCVYRMMQEPNVLKKLKTIRSAHWDIGNSITMELFVPLLERPSLEVFSGRRIDATGRISRFATTTIRSINLEGSALDAQGFSRLLQSCPSLENFSINICGGWIADCSVDFEEFGKALIQHGKRLTCLEIWFERSGGIFDDIIGAPFPSLKETSLEHLKVPISAVSGFYRHTRRHDTAEEMAQLQCDSYLMDILPHSLKRLELHEAIDSMFDATLKRQTATWLSPSLYAAAQETCEAGQDWARDLKEHYNSLHDLLASGEDSWPIIDDHKKTLEIIYETKSFCLHKNQDIHSPMWDCCFMDTSGDTEQL